MIPTPFSISSLSLHTHHCEPCDLLRTALVFQLYLFSLNGEIERWMFRRSRTCVSYYFPWSTLLRTPGFPPTELIVPGMLFFFYSGLLHILLPLLGTPFLWLLVRPTPTSFILQDAVEMLLSPRSLSASTADVPQHYVLTFIGSLTTLHLNICFLIHFLHLTLSDLLSYVQHLA